jgi:hypothetical protein
MLHIMKLAVGTTDIDDLRIWQAERLRTTGVLKHRTRMAPRRRDEVLDGGSLYWVISGSLRARQRILDVVDDERDDKTPCTALILDPDVVQLAGRPTRPFQGWRYLNPADAPPDLPDIGAIVGIDRLPAALRQELQTLCLL